MTTKMNKNKQGYMAILCCLLCVFCVAPGAYAYTRAIDANGNCSLLCASSDNTMQLDNKTVIPLFASKNTAPAMDVMRGDTTCYMDMVSGTLAGVPGLVVGVNNYRAFTADANGWDCDLQLLYRYLCDVGGTVVKTDTITDITQEYTVGYTGCTKTGYSFNEWGASTIPTVNQGLFRWGNGTTFKPEDKAALQQNMYFIPQWEPNKYIATFSCNGGGTPPSNQNVLYNDTMTLPNNTCSRTDYWFTGWTQNNGTTYYQPGDTYTWNVTSDQTFNAGWMTRYDAGISGSASSGNTTNNTWTATFSYGTVNGTSRCSSTGGNFSGTALPDSAVANDGGKWCWCKMAINNTSLESGWVPLFGYSADITENASADAAMCAANCATHCGYMMANYESLRGTMYASVYVNQPLAVDYNENSKDGKYVCNDLGYNSYGKGLCKDNGLTGGGAAGIWDTEFSYGKVSGIASCNNTSGIDYNSTAPAASMNSSSTGQYCWCKPTLIANESTASAPWVYHSIHTGADDCAVNCAYVCANNVALDSGIRGALYTAAGIANSN